MKRHIRIALVALILATSAVAQDAPAEGQDLKLSPELMNFLRAEMRALLGGVQDLPVGIATADWKGVAATAAQIRDSYILTQNLTDAQKAELEVSVPEHFKRLDAEFHREAQKLEAAAIRHDAQLSTFYYYRLLETCTACHSRYAPSRFPAFGGGAQAPHGH